MNPTRTRTSVGLETPQETVARAQQMTGVATSQTPRQMSTPAMTLNIPDTVPAAALSNNRTVSDVVARRNQMEQEQLGRQQLTTDYNALLGRMEQTPGGLIFQNPQEFLSRLLLNEPTTTQVQIDQQRAQQAEAIRGFAGEYQQAGQQAREDFNITGLTQQLQETNEKIAERTNRLRQTLRDFEVNAERRGVAREFVDAERFQVEADATAELADLYIIQSAQSGNLELANEQITNVLSEMEKFFEFEKAGIQAEIDRLQSIDTREAEKRASQLSIALTNYQTQAQEALAVEREKRGYMVDAAANGADTATLDAIRNAKTPGEAALMAGPWIGRLVRQEELNLAREKFESESADFGSGTITTADGMKAVVTADGTVTPVSQINFDDPAQVDALPVSNITKAVMQGFAKTKDLTPTQRGEVIAELQAIGFNPNTYVVNKLNSLVESWATLPEANRGYIEGLKFWESKTNPDVATFESQKQLLTREIARLFDVGVLSDQDVQAYKDAMPSRQDSSLEVVISKAAGIAGAASGVNPENAGKRIRLKDGREAIVGTDGETLLDPVTAKPLE